MEIYSNTKQGLCEKIYTDSWCKLSRSVLVSHQVRNSFSDICIIRVICQEKSPIDVKIAFVNHFFKNEIFVS